MRASRRAPLLPRTWLPCAVTGAGIVTGMIAMVLAAKGRYDSAVYLLVLAVCLDILDGRVARWLNATSKMGQQLDSFNDSISFGAAPALLVFLSLLEPMGFFGILIAVTYLLAGVFRLARFNLTSDPHSHSRHCTGVPIPVGAGYLMVLVLMRDSVPVAAGAVVVLLAAVAMTGRWKLPALKGANRVTLMLFVGILNYLAVVVWPNWYTVAWWNAWNLAIVAVARNREQLAIERTGET